MNIELKERYNKNFANQCQLDINPPCMSIPNVIDNAPIV